MFITRDGLAFSQHGLNHLAADTADLKICRFVTNQEIPPAPSK